MEMTDESIMPFGKYKGTKIANVPAGYLIWLYDSGLNNGPIKDYIIDNMDVLKSEIKRIKK